jgi:SAM-dependent methyltransferase
MSKLFAPGNFSSYGEKFFADGKYNVKFRDDMMSILPEREYYSIAEFGCADGFNLLNFANKLNIKNPNVVGVDVCKSNASNYTNFDFHHESVEDFLQKDKRFFDLILMSDVLEHVYNPWQVLNETKNHLSQNGILCISIPNIENLNFIKSINEGDFYYTETGLMDETHIRFFSLKSIIYYLELSGYVVKNTSFRPDNSLSNIKEQVIKNLTEKNSVKLNIGNLSIEINSRNVHQKFGQQILICAENVK